jgi:NAD(P)-dependent dehydrogenase (short-subunit alcohol dehydrogenase family)
MMPGGESAPLTGTSHAPIGMLEGKVAVITGAGQGIGRACARVFVREGARVLAVDFNGSQHDVAAELGASVVPFHADVSNEADIAAMFAAAIGAFGRVDCALQVAGTQGGRGDGLEFTAEDYEHMTATNLRGVMFCMKHAVRAMLPTGGGSIVNFTSVAAINAEQMAPLAYTAAKAGVQAVSKVYAVDYAKQGVRVNVIAPGFTITELTASGGPEVFTHMGAKSAIGRPAQASEQAEVAAFLASDRASYVTGVVIPVDGGWTARLV